MLTEGMYVADRYEIIGKIGAGGMSDVFKANDLVRMIFCFLPVHLSETDHLLHQRMIPGNLYNPFPMDHIQTAVPHICRIQGKKMELMLR